MFNVTNLADGGVTLDVDAANLARRQAKLCPVTFFGDQLRRAARRPHHLRALARTQLDVVNRRAERDKAQRQGIAGDDVSFRPGNYRLADLQAERRDNVTLLTIGIMQQGNVGRAVRIVFDGGDFGRNARLVALEIDDAILALVAAATTAHGNVAIIVASRNALLRRKQRLMRLDAGRQLIAREISLIAPRW